MRVGRPSIASSKMSGSETPILSYSLRWPPTWHTNSLEAKACYDQRPLDVTPLFFLVRLGGATDWGNYKRDTLKILLERGANGLARGAKGCHILHTIGVTGGIWAADLVLESGVPLNVANSRGQYALDCIGHGERGVGGKQPTRNCMESFSTEGAYTVRPGTAPVDLFFPFFLFLLFLLFLFLVFVIVALFLFLFLLLLFIILIFFQVGRSNRTPALTARKQPQAPSGRSVCPGRAVGAGGVGARVGAVAPTSEWRLGLPGSSMSLCAPLRFCSFSLAALLRRAASAST